MIKPIKIGALVVASALALAACGGSSDSGSGNSGKSFVVATDYPLQGATADTMQSINDMIALILENQGGKAGDYNITLKQYDNSTAAKGAWDDAACAKNAQDHVAALDEIAVVGTHNSGCSKIIIPVLNQDPNGPMLMVSGSNTNPGLTKTWDPGEPDKFYPTGKRNYARVIVSDDLQGTAGMQYAAAKLGVKKCAVLDDKSTYSQGVAKAVVAAAPAAGIEIVLQDGYDMKATNYVAIMEKIKGLGADCLYLSADFSSNGGQVIKEATKVLGPATKFTMMASSGLSGYADFLAMPESNGVWINFNGRSQAQIVAEGGAAAKIITDFKTKYGHEPNGSWSLQSGAAFQAVLAAIAASDGTRASVTDQIFKVNIPAKDSLIGSDIKFDANGDISDRVVDMIRVTDGKEVDTDLWTVK